MTRKDAKKLLPIMRAYSVGKKIQFFNGEDWIDKEILSFDSEPHRYRIKPKTKYRPFKSKEECWEEMHKHPDFGWVKCKQWGYYASLGCVGNIIKRSEDECHKDSFDFMYTEYTFTDGEPFGIKEEE